MFGRKSKEKDGAFARLHHKPIRSISVKDSLTYRERIIGREGVINISENDLIVLCDNAEVFRKPLMQIEIAELMSHDGFTIRILSDDSDIYTVHYTK